jgi:hypothetical protein
MQLAAERLHTRPGALGSAARSGDSFGHAA